MNVLVDTPIWSALFRRGDRSPEADELDSLVRDGRAVLLGPVLQELLSGICKGQQFVRLAAALRPFPLPAIDVDDYVLAAEFFSLCRSKGVQGSNTDFLLCAYASRREVSIFTLDKDFEGFRKHLPIRLYREL